jgi:hypothetical protein
MLLVSPLLGSCPFVLILKSKGIRRGAGIVFVGVVHQIGFSYYNSNAEFMMVL